MRLVRIFNTYGPNMHPQDGRVVSNFIMQALRDREIVLYGTGEQTRSFQYVDDLVRAMRAYMAPEPPALQSWFAERGMDVPVLNVGNPAEFTIRELADKVLQLIPESRSRIVHRELPKDDPQRRRPDIALARELLQWEPTVPLDEGLRRTIAYFRGVAAADRAGGAG